MVTLGLTKARARKSPPQPDPHSSVTPRVLSDAGGVPGHDVEAAVGNGLRSRGYEVRILAAAPKTRARFGLKIDRSGGPGACWPWTGARNLGGYGSFRIGGHVTRAHRVAWALAGGKPAGDLWILHRCDNPPCCNPAHLFLGTPKENTADAIAKGRLVDFGGHKPCRLCKTLGHYAPHCQTLNQGARP